MRVQIDNEYDKLEAVMVHRPGPEIDRLTHENMKGFLFEDIPYLRRMQEEHDAFVGVLRSNGVEVLLLDHLLGEVLADETVRRSLIDQVCQVAAMPAIVDDLVGLKHWTVPELVTVLLAGLTASEYTHLTGHRISSGADGDGSSGSFLLPPVPNAYFTRDPAVVVRDTAVSSKMHYRERVRETLLMRAVLEHHPIFRGNAITYGGSEEPTEDRPYTIEGGDVIILSPEVVLVGCSERTRSETIERLAGNCFDFSQVKRVYEIPIPADRAFMHLDTVFTVIDRGKILWFGDVMENVPNIHRYEPVTDDPKRTQRVAEDRSFLDILRDEFECDVTVVDTAGGLKPFAAREQRMDASNALAIAPSVVVTYERNEYTTEALRENGVKCIGIDDSELVRGLGGPRCMTMPLRRSHSQ